MFSKNIMSDSGYICGAIPKEMRTLDIDINKNCEYMNKHGNILSTIKNEKNIRDIYKRGWLHITNLVIGNILLIYFIMKQK
jgi:hypothetical protein